MLLLLNFNGFTQVSSLFLGVQKKSISLSDLRSQIVCDDTGMPQNLGPVVHEKFAPFWAKQAI